mgnify:CR=1
ASASGMALRYVMKSGGKFGARGF